MEIDPIIASGSSTGSISPSSTSSSKKFQCDQCDKSYHKPSLLQQHQRSHTGERPFECAVCHATFLRKSHLTAHMVSHQEEKPFKCGICGKGVNSRQHLKRHEITHTKSFKCTRDGCSESFYKHQSLRHHILSVHDKALYCKICEKDFKRPYRLTQHNLKFHGEAPAYQCDNPGCFSNFKTWSALQLHIKTEHPKLKCPVCRKRCSGRNGLQSHMAIHQEDQEKPNELQCAYCEIDRFSDKSALIQHYREYHDSNIPEELAKLDSGVPLNTNNLRIYEGLSSDEEEEVRHSPGSQASIDTLNSTLRSKGSIIDLISGNYTKSIPCPKKSCSRSFVRDYDLQRHLKWHAEHLKKVEMYLESLKREESETENLKINEEDPKSDKNTSDNSETKNEIRNQNERYKDADVNGTTRAHENDLSISADNDGVNRNEGIMKMNVFANTDANTNDANTDANSNDAIIGSKNEEMTTDDTTTVHVEHSNTHDQTSKDPPCEQISSPSTVTDNYREAQSLKRESSSTGGEIKRARCN